jgi:hypothetical protein
MPTINISRPRYGNSLVTPGLTDDRRLFTAKWRDAAHPPHLPSAIRFQSCLLRTAAQIRPKQGRFGYEQNYGSRGDVRCDGDDRHLVESRSVEARSRRESYESRGRGRATDNLASRHHVNARQNSSDRGVARCILNLRAPCQITDLNLSGLRDALHGDVASMSDDVAPNFYPAAIGVWRSVMPSWAVMAAVCEAEPSVERSAADRRAAA